MDCVALAPSFDDEIDDHSADGDVAADTDDSVAALDDVPANINIVMMYELELTRLDRQVRSKSLYFHRQ